MLVKTVTVHNKLGLHARPAALLTKTASLFECSIRLIKGEKIVDAKSIISVMTLAAKSGDELTISIDGENEIAAMQTLIGLFESRFGEAE